MTMNKTLKMLMDLFALVIVWAVFLVLSGLVLKAMYTVFRLGWDLV